MSGKKKRGMSFLSDILYVDIDGGDEGIRWLPRPVEARRGPGTCLILSFETLNGGASEETYCDIY
jgi:hypothetical protein